MSEPRASVASVENLSDIPNLLAGALAGFLLSLPFFFHERREREREVGITWTKDLRQFESALALPTTRAQDVHEYFSTIPVDHYRRVLGPADSRLVEDLQNAYWAAEKGAADHVAATKEHYARRVSPAQRRRSRVRDLQSREARQDCRRPSR